MKTKDNIFTNIEKLASLIALVSIVINIFLGVFLSFFPNTERYNGLIFGIFNGIAIVVILTIYIIYRIRKSPYPIDFSLYIKSIANLSNEDFRQFRKIKKFYMSLSGADYSKDYSGKKIELTEHFQADRMSEISVIEIDESISDIKTVKRYETTAEWSNLRFYYPGDLGGGRKVPSLYLSAHLWVSQREG